MDESLRLALVDYINKTGGVATQVTGVEVYTPSDRGGCDCCDDGEAASVDIGYLNAHGRAATREVFDSELQDLLLHLLKAVPQ